MEQQDIIIPSTQKPKSNFLFFVVIFCALLLSISSLYLGYQISHSQKQKVISATPIPVEIDSNLKTYTNNQYNFEFKYSSKFITTSAYTENIVLALQNNDNKNQRISTLPDIYLRVLEIPRGQTSESIMNKNVVSGGMGWDENSINKITTKKIGQNLVYYVRTGVFEGILTTNYFVVNDNHIYAFVVNSNPVDWTNPNYKIEDDQLNKDFLEILSTFKFLN